MVMDAHVGMFNGTLWMVIDARVPHGISRPVRMLISVRSHNSAQNSLGMWGGEILAEAW